MNMQHARSNRVAFRIATLSGALLGVYGSAYAQTTLNLNDGGNYSIPSTGLPDASPYSYVDVRSGSSLDATCLIFNSTRGGQQGALTAMGGSINIRNSLFTVDSSTPTSGQQFRTYGIQVLADRKSTRLNSSH